MQRREAIVDGLRTIQGYLTSSGGWAPKEVVRNRPLVVLGVSLLAAQTYVAVRTLARLGPRERLVLQDSVIPEYIGWVLADGGRLYLDMWEIKPPVPFELTGLIALLAGDDVLLYHSLSVAVTCAAAIGGALLVGALVLDATDDGVAAIVAGLVPFVFPQFFWRAIVGFKAKYFVVFFGLLTVYLAVRKRPTVAGIVGALAAGTWQLAVVFPVVGLGLTAQYGDRSAVARYLAGAIGSTVVVLAPVLAWGGDAVGAMLVEVVLTPFLVPEGSTIADRLRHAMLALGRTFPVMLLGLLGLLASLRPREIRGAWWAPACGLWFTAMILLVDFDTRNDLIPWVALMGVGLGLLLGTSSRRDPNGTDIEHRRAPGTEARRALIALVVVMATVSVITLGGYGTGPGKADPETYTLGSHPPGALDLPYNKTERQSVYWTRVPPETCRIFAGRTQYQLVKRMGLTERPDVRYFEVACGQWGPAWNLFRQTYGVAP